MFKKILIAVLVALPLSVVAQNIKIGVIDVMSIVSVVNDRYCVF